jgi:hypothetical protein
MRLFHELGNAAGHAIDDVHGLDASGHGGFVAAVDVSVFVRTYQAENVVEHT